MRLTQLEQHAMLFTGKSVNSFKADKGCVWFTLQSGRECTIVTVTDSKVIAHTVSINTSILNGFGGYSLPCWLLQVFNYRTSKPLLLPADGGVDAHHRSLLYSQTAAAGSALFCPWLSTTFLLCHEHPGGGSSWRSLPLNHLNKPAPLIWYHQAGCHTRDKYTIKTTKTTTV